jgi:hypothetical protein
MPRRLLTLMLCAVAIAAAGCSDSNSSTGPSTHVDGTTPAWFNGQEVQLDYTRDFECRMPPTAASASRCEIGADATIAPASSGAIPPLWVLVPLGFTPDAATLQCPQTGQCVDHPHDLDVSRVFGAGTETFPLPPHSHIIDDDAGHADVPWIVRIVGVKDLETWNDIASQRSLTELRSVQTSDPSGTHVTGDIPTNLVLFFKVH